MTIAVGITMPLRITSHPFQSGQKISELKHEKITNQSQQLWHKYTAALVKILQ